MHDKTSRIAITTCLAVLAVGHCTRADDAKVDVELAKQAVGILENRCVTCHGDNKPRVAGRKVLDRDTLLQVRNDEAWLVPGDLENSALWTAIADNYMPYNADFSSVPLPEAEKAVIKKWIEDGAHYPGNTPRPFLSDGDVLEAIAFDLFGQSPNRVKSLRYFSIHHLHNNWKRVSEKHLRLYRAALSKAVNSLTDESSLRIPRAVPNTHDTVFVVDIKELGWDQILLDKDGNEGPTRWQRIVAAYPYGFEPDSTNNREAFDAYEKIKLTMRGDFERVPYVRADWFVATATRPPLYHDILGIPKDVRDLEARLGVERQEDFKDDRLLRAGVQESGVSAQNRLVDWHRMSSRQGSYWISYDFVQNSARGNITRFPLGPKFPGNDFDDFAFEHDGGEIVYRLNNGMHGYMLVDAEGNRINSGPVSIVWDTRQVSGTPEIVNGLSCIHCHQFGVRSMVDVVGRSAALFNTDANQKVREMFRNDEFQRRLADDRKSFVAALEEVVGPFLQVGEDADKDIEEFPEPLAFAAVQYNRDMRLEDCAHELGVDPEVLRGQQTNRGILKLGLKPLFEGEAIKRSMWAAVNQNFSPFQLTVRQMSLGIGTAVENVDKEFDLVDQDE